MTAFEFLNATTTRGIAEEDEEEESICSAESSDKAYLAMISPHSSAKLLNLVFKITGSERISSTLEVLAFLLFVVILSRREGAEEEALIVIESSMVVSDNLFLLKKRS